MTHVSIHRRAAGILAIALAIALSTTVPPASARTFSFNSAGSMVQQPLPPQWACVMQRALSSGSLRFQCRESSDLKASAIVGDVAPSQRWGTAAIATRRQQHRATDG
jgi:hypothetical protein